MGNKFRKKLVNVRFVLFILISGIALALLVGAAMLFQQTVVKDNVPDAYVGKTVWHNGVAYYPRQDITTLLVMGIDRSGPAINSGSHNNDGLADVVMLVVFNKSVGKYNVISFNRDTMVEMPVLGIAGRPVGTDYAQLALSHTYGNGLHTSCENTANTISGLLNGVEIDYYLSMNMDAVSILNDAIGGVRVTVEDDFSEVDSTIKMGEMVLDGQQAINFVRLRHGVGDQLNISRMKRQEAYIDGFIEAFRSSIGYNASKGMKIYDKIRPYVVSNISDRIVAEIFEMISNYTYGDIVTPPGENIAGEKYMEFYLNEDQFKDKFLHMLFERK